MEKNKVVIITLPKKNAVIFSVFLFLAIVIPVSAIVGNTKPFAIGQWEFTATLVGIYLFLFGFSVYLFIQLKKLREIIKILLNQIEKLGIQADD